MSWSFGAKAKTKEEVIDAFNEVVAKSEQCTIKDNVRYAGQSLVEEFTDEGDNFEVSTYGHINSDGSGNVTVSIKVEKST